jgi:hypothetical protein
VAFLPAPLTARAVGTISKQAGLSIQGSVVGNQGSTMIAGRWLWTLEISMLVKGRISEIGNRYA